MYLIYLLILLIEDDQVYQIDVPEEIINLEELWETEESQMDKEGHRWNYSKYLNE